MIENKNIVSNENMATNKNLANNANLATNKNQAPNKNVENKKKYTIIRYTNKFNKIMYVNEDEDKNKKINKKEIKENNVIDITLYNSIVHNMINRWQKDRDSINNLLNTGSPYYNEENLWDIYNNPYVDEDLYEESDEELDDIESENNFDLDYYQY
tara:strand:+ start:774 stop:1241 length:468 start_codon:yes stop_codon:yes gene_type:complete